jgi:phospholipase C
MAATIEHLVVLMMENRSFDHMLGFLRAPDYQIDGLSGLESNTDSAGNEVRATRSARHSGDLTTDPSHDFFDVMEQMFGTRAPAAGQQPDMSGFVRNYERFAGSPERGARIMRCFDRANLSVLSTLAREYAVCDRWFASVPGPTLPNRVYAHAGTSRGRLDLSPDFIGGFTTIYEVLWNNRVQSAIFYSDWSGALMFDFLLKHQNQLYAPFNRFLELCRTNRLPAYSFIEPRYNPVREQGNALPANDQHPDHDVAAGEFLIKTVYDALRSSDDVWKSSMLLVVYDEHGGIYDHVGPGMCESPDGLSCQSPPFDFTRLGPRVPAVIVSPYVARGTIVHDLVFDHTSILATAMALFTAAGVWPSNILGDRAMNANTFDTILDLDSPPRMERPDFGAVTPGVHVPAVGLSSLQYEQLWHAAELEQRLPLDLRTGINPDKISNEHDAGAYVALVTERLAQATREGRLGH